MYIARYILSKADITRQKILKTAIEIAKKDGLKDLTARNVAKCANVAIGTLYNYYPSIDDLTLEATEYIVFSELRKHVPSYRDGEKFTDYLRRIYPRIEDVIDSFTHDYVTQMYALSTSFRNKGLKRRHEACKQVVAGIQVIIESDPTITYDKITDTIDTHTIALDTALGIFWCAKEKASPEFLFCLLENTLY